MKKNETIIKNEEEAIFGLRRLYSAHGYTRFAMSKFEEYDLYVRNKSFLVSDNVITFTDTSGKLMALKPDVTLSIVKNTRDDPDGVRKVYYNENVYRVSDKSHTFREIMQVGLECLGRIDNWRRTEVLTLAAESLALISPDYVLDISHLGLLSEAVDRLGLTSEDREAVFRCVGEKNRHGIDEILCRAGKAPADASLLKALITLNADPTDALLSLSALFDNTAAEKTARDFGAVLSALAQNPLYEGRIRVDFSVINDMNYYNGVVFKGFIRGIPSGVLSGGEYDNLMRKMGKKAGAIGFAVYLDLLEELAAPPAPYDLDVVLLYDDKTPLTRLAQTARELTDAGKRVGALRTIPPKLTYHTRIDLTSEVAES